MSRRSVQIALAALVVVNLVLVAFALHHVRGSGGDDGDDTPAAAAVADDEVPAGGQVPFEYRASTSVTADVANDGTVARATRGSCSGRDRATLMVSTSPDRDPKQVSSPLRVITAVDTENGGVVTVVGGTDGCQTQQQRSTDGGETFTPEPVTLWHVTPRDPARLALPQRESKPGCTVTSLSKVGDTFGRVSCTDGTIRGTGDTGARWVKLGRLDNVRVMTFSSFTRGYALARYEGCAAQAFSTDDGGRTWTAGGCITGQPAQALASNDSQLLAVVGGSYFVSTDRGRDFSAR